MQKDLKDIGIAAKTESGVLDFHALRHTFGTRLTQSGVTQREIQALMRHSDANLTAKRYTDVNQLPVALAVQRLPRLFDAKNSPLNSPLSLDFCSQIESSADTENKAKNVSELVVKEDLSHSESPSVTKGQKWVNGGGNRIRTCGRVSESRSSSTVCRNINKGSPLVSPRVNKEQPIGLSKGDYASLAELVSAWPDLSERTRLAISKLVATEGRGQ